MKIWQLAIGILPRPLGDSRPTVVVSRLRRALHPKDPQSYKHKGHTARPDAQHIAELIVLERRELDPRGYRRPLSRAGLQSFSRYVGVF